MLITSYVVYFQRVMQLNRKGFHLTMLVLIAACYLFNGIENVFCLLYFKRIQSQDIADAVIFYHAD
jgi:hypothetical protein